MIRIFGQARKKSKRDGLHICPVMHILADGCKFLLEHQIRYLALSKSRILTGLVSSEGTTIRRVSKGFVSNEVLLALEVVHRIACGKGYPVDRSSVESGWLTAESAALATPYKDNAAGTSESAVQHARSTE